MQWESIYGNHKNLVYNLALHYTNNQHDAEEITQDVFMRVYRGLPDFRQEADIKSWIYRITVNCSLDHIKKQKRRKNIFTSFFFPDAEIDQMVADRFDHPGVQMEHSEALKALMLKIYALPENQKTAVILLKIEDLSQKEVAQIMDISEKAVESLFQRAKANLKKSM